MAGLTRLAEIRARLDAAEKIALSWQVSMEQDEVRLLLAIAEAAHRANTLYRSASQEGYDEWMDALDLALAPLEKEET